MTKYELRITGECKQNLKICKKRGLPMQELWDVVAKLLRGEKLDEKYQAHQLHGNRKGQDLTRKSLATLRQCQTPARGGSLCQAPAAGRWALDLYA